MTTNTLKPTPTDDPHPWERHASDTPKAWEAFAIYRDLGAGRTLGQVARSLGKSEQLVHRWAQSHLWVERILAWDQHLDRLWTERMTGERVEALERQLALTRELQDLGSQWLAKLRTRLTSGRRMPDDAVMARMLIAAMTQEREILGIGADGQGSTSIDVVMVDARMFPTAPPAALIVEADVDRRAG